MADVGVRVKALGEIAIRVHDIDRMAAFYGDVLELPLLRRFDDKIVFFDLGESYGGHVGVLALFNAELAAMEDSSRWTGLDVKEGTLHHIALTIDAADYDAAHQALVDRGVEVRTATFPWIGWRSLFMFDPEGNVVELVSRDPSMTPEDAEMRAREAG